MDTIFDLSKYHKNGIRGQGIKVAVLDSGLAEIYDNGNGDYDDMLKTAKVVDFTNDGNSFDTIGHGTFLAGVIGSQNEDCVGMAPDSELYILKLFS